jgi:stage IV sporulation protein FB
VLLSEPQPTSYDLKFSLFGFHVRTHPAFFIMPILLGRGLIDPNMNAGIGMLLLVAIFFVSILVHELGHALAFRYFGMHSRIVLYWMGGLAIPEGAPGGWSSRKTGSLTSMQQVVVSLAGPIFGLLLAAFLVGVVYAFQGHVEIAHLGVIPLPLPELSGTVLDGSRAVFMVLWGGIIINIVLNLFNLVPIYPLDGGQVARQLMAQMDSQNGIKNSIILSIGAAIVMALFSLKLGSTFMMIFFGFMAFSNYQSLQGGRRW